MLYLLEPIYGFLKFFPCFDKELILISVFVQKICSLSQKNVALGAAADCHAMLSVKALEDFVSFIKTLIRLFIFLGVHELKHPLQLHQVSF